MPDIDDIASEQEQFARDNAQRMRKPEGPQAIGVCHNCEEPVAVTLRWCDSDCQKDWQKQQDYKRHDSA